MWELRGARSQGNLTLRNLLLFVTALVVTVFAYLFISAPSVGAQAVWDGSSIEYQNKIFTRNNDDRVKDDANIPAGAAVFQYVPQSARTIEFIYFTDSDSAGTADSAQYVTFDFDPPFDISNPSPVQTISVDPRAATDEEAAALEETSSCEVDSIGWLVCPVTNFLASGMDWLFGALSEMLEVRRIELGSDTPLFRSWKMMQGIANLAFILAFLVIIYSQITSVGIQNYSIKRLLPRLIIAAILVNISYYICAAAIDLSNIAGYSLQEIFINMRNNIVGEEGNGWQTIKWEDLASFILAGGAAVGVGGFTITTTVAAYGVGGAIILLLPALVGVLLAVLVALLVLAARQAIITVLVILAPLAFVAYLLPNTEKWFDKWKDLFMTMLLLFPIFSLLFGGAQLAGTAIIQNSNGSINVIILGMVTQVAPIVITPLLIKFSGSLIGRIAGMVNNPNRGLIDRTRNFAKGEADRMKSRRTSEVMKKPPRKGQLLRRTARGIEMRNRRREQEMALWKQEAELGFEKAKLTSPKIQKLDVELQLANLDTENAKNDLRERVSRLRAGDASGLLDQDDRRIIGRTVNPRAFASEALRRATEADTDSRVLANQIREAESTQRVNFAKQLAESESLRNRAGGINQESGPQSAWAAAIAEIEKAEETAISEARSLADYYNFKSEDYKNMAMTGSVTVVDDNGVSRTFTRDNKYMRKAALREMFTVGVVPEIDEMIEMSGRQGVVSVDADGNITKEGLFEFRETIAAALAKSSHGQKTVYGTGKLINDVKSGTIGSEHDLNASILSYVQKGKFSAEKLATMDAQAIDRLLKAIEEDNRGMIAPEKRADVDRAVAELRATAYQALTDSRTKSSVTSASKPLLLSLQGGYTPPDPEAGSTTT